ncbi:LPXTG cell wall anchor domain-containing protein [Aeromicrobium sp.]|uniref:LPXTG cell wall anchor domain-containing protein n=1 Tax=Aeromicrobium sp. TaxID=1871063 RepID=UPI0039E60483
MPTVTYYVEDEDGTPYQADLVGVVAAQATDDEATGSGTVTFDPLANDEVPSGVTLDPSTVRLFDSSTGQWVTELVVEQGRWTVDVTTGLVTFTPADGFTGEVPAVWYRVTGSDGVVYSAQLIAEVTASAAGVLPVTGGTAALAGLFGAMLLLGLGTLVLRYRRRSSLA